MENNKYNPLKKEDYLKLYEMSLLLDQQNAKLKEMGIKTSDSNFVEMLDGIKNFLDSESKNE